VERAEGGIQQERRRRSERGKRGHRWRRHGGATGAGRGAARHRSRPYTTRGPLPHVLLAPPLMTMGDEDKHGPSLSSSSKVRPPAASPWECRAGSTAQAAVELASSPRGANLASRRRRRGEPASARRHGLEGPTPRTATRETRPPPRAPLLLERRGHLRMPPPERRPGRHPDLLYVQRKVFDNIVCVVHGGSHIVKPQLIRSFCD
jgi:hypothetical protein